MGKTGSGKLGNRIPRRTGAVPEQMDWLRVRIQPVVDTLKSEKGCTCDQTEDERRTSDPDNTPHSAFFLQRQRFFGAERLRLLKQSLVLSGLRAVMFLGSRLRLVVRGLRLRSFG